MPLTKQEAFDRVYLGLAAQGFRFAYDKEADQCRYRADDGCKCAIGLLIEDSEYVPEMEGEAVDAIIPRVSALNPELVGFYGALQSAHDESNTPEELKAWLEEIAIGGEDENGEPYPGEGLTIPAIPA